MRKRFRYSPFKATTKQRILTIYRRQRQVDYNTEGKAFDDMGSRKFKKPVFPPRSSGSVLFDIELRNILNLEDNTKIFVVEALSRFQESSELYLLPLPVQELPRPLHPRRRQRRGHAGGRVGYLHRGGAAPGIGKYEKHYYSRLFT